ncbi:MAG TPA: acetyl-CoA carboxylase biotin carboxyl carrier protein subunit, partial [Alicycliphilus sp.]|nr:acetyl-CoA carboxylase biotin carboxyl carrier protein subunit [Alicycliphilus sp.]
SMRARTACRSASAASASMKMEIPVEAEAAGTVRKLLVAVGEQIAEGQAVAEIE